MEAGRATKERLTSYMVTDWLWGFFVMSYAAGCPDVVPSKF